jgi:hypothetical protein
MQLVLVAAAEGPRRDGVIAAITDSNFECVVVTAETAREAAYYARRVALAAVVLDADFDDRPAIIADPALAGVPITTVLPHWSAGEVRQAVDRMWAGLERAAEAPAAPGP